MIVREYETTWAREFRDLRDVLTGSLSEVARAIHHVGSTAIPGMLAKPILDVDVELAPAASIDKASERLIAMGYVHEGEKGIPQRHAYARSSSFAPHVQPPRRWMDHHLYVCPSGSAELRRHLRFRDALVAAPSLRDEYRAIKERCAAMASGDRQRYQAAKDGLGADFFARVLAMEPIAGRLNGAHDLMVPIDAALESGEIDEAEWHRRTAAFLTPAYLAAGNPRAQSGHSGDDARWEHARSLVAEAIDRDGTFLDVGCASGYLMETLTRWCAQRNVRIEPYGLDIAPELADLARRRLPQWADRIFIGNAIQWTGPARFDFVRTGLEYVPSRRHRDLVQHLLDHVVAPSGRLIVGVYNEARASVETPLTADLVESWGHTIGGRLERPHADCRICYRLFWIDRGSGILGPPCKQRTGTVTQGSS